MFYFAGGFDAAGGQNGEDAGSDVEDDGDGHLAKLRHEKTQFLLQLEQVGEKLERSRCICVVFYSRFLVPT